MGALTRTYEPSDSPCSGRFALPVTGDALVVPLHVAVQQHLEARRRESARAATRLGRERRGQSLCRAPQGLRAVREAGDELLQGGKQRTRRFFEDAWFFSGALSALSRSERPPTLGVRARVRGRASYTSSGRRNTSASASNPGRLAASRVFRICCGFARQCGANAKVSSLERTAASS